MALYFIDTSALVKLYVREQGTDRMLALAAASSGNQLAILSLTPVELRSAIRRREKAGDIPSSTADRLVDIFQLHLQSRFAAQPITDYILDLACQLVDRHCLRALDAVQLGGYLNLCNSTGPVAPIFVAADHELLAAAAKENLSIFDPTV